MPITRLSIRIGRRPLSEHNQQHVLGSAPDEGYKNKIRLAKVYNLVRPMD